MKGAVRNPNARLERELGNLREADGLRVCDVDWREDNSVKILLEIPPAYDIYLETPWPFSIEVPNGYPQKAPRCLGSRLPRRPQEDGSKPTPTSPNRAALSERLCNSINLSASQAGAADPNKGEEELPLQVTQEGDMGWSSIYTLSVCAFAVRNLFALDGMPVRYLEQKGPGLGGGGEPWTQGRATAAHACRQGKRRTMEDVVFMADTFEKRYALYCIFDGHGGNECSTYAGQTFPGALTSILGESSAAGEGSQAPSRHALEAEAMAQALSEVDSTFCRRYDVLGLCGSTALIALLKFDPKAEGSGEESVPTLIMGNVGDSRAVACVGGTAVPLTVDAKPTRPDEVARVVDRGGFVVGGRVGGQLAVTRSLGDRDLKSMGQAFITCWPEASALSLEPRVEFVLLACDGLWDVMSNQAAVDTARKCLTTLRMPPEQAAQRLVDDAIDKLGSKDNVSVLLIVKGTGAAAAEARRDLKIEEPDSLDLDLELGLGFGGLGLGSGGREESPPPRPPPAVDGRDKPIEDDEELMEFLMDDANFT